MPVHRDKRQRDRWRWQFNRVIRGRRYRASRLLPAGWDRARAEAYDRQETARLYAVASGLEPQEPLISEAVRLYVEHHLPGRRNAPDTTRALAALLPHYEGQPLSELPRIAREYATQPGLAPATIRNRLSYLRAAARYAWRHHQLGTQDHGARMPMPSVSNARHRYIRPEDLAPLLDRASDDLAAIITLAIYTGCRWISELLPRQPSDVLREGADVWLAIPSTKTGRPHMVWIHPAARGALARLPFARHWRTYSREWDDIRAQAGHPGLRLHDLRHSLASALISSGATLAEVGAALNHRSPASTSRYAHLYPERLRDVVGKMPTIPERRPKKRA